MNNEQNVQNLHVCQHSSNEMLAVRATCEVEQATELLKALRITNAILQGLCERGRASEDVVYKIEGNSYRVGDVLDSNDELIGNAVAALNFTSAETS